MKRYDVVLCFAVANLLVAGCVHQRGAAPAASVPVVKPVVTNSPASLPPSPAPPKSVSVPVSAMSNPPPVVQAATPKPAPQPSAPNQSLSTMVVFDADLKEATVKTGVPDAHFTFCLTNVASADITIGGVSTSCGCTVAKLPASPWKLAPGEGGEIHVTMNVAGKSGTVSKTVTVNSDKGSKILTVKTTILPAPAATPAGEHEHN